MARCTEQDEEKTRPIPMAFTQQSARLPLKSLRPRCRGPHAAMELRPFAAGLRAPAFKVAATRASLVLLWCEFFSPQV